MEQPRLEPRVRIDTSVMVWPKQHEIFLSFSYDDDAEEFQQWIDSGFCWKAFMDWRSEAKE